MEEFLRAQFLDSAAITAIVAARIDWGMRPQGDPTPGIALHLISDVPERKMTGAPTWHDARVQVDCWGNTAGEAARIRRAVTAFAEGFRAVLDGKKYRIFVLDADGKTMGSHGQADVGAVDFRASVDLRVSYQV